MKLREWNGGIHRCDGLPNALSESGRIPTRADGEMNRASGPIGLVDGWDKIVAQAVVAAVAHHANNLVSRVSLWFDSQSKAASQRILVWEETLGEKLVDDHGVRVRTHVGVGDRPASDDRNAQGFKESVSYAV